MQAPRQQDHIQQVSIDCVISGYQEKQLKVLIPKLRFKGNFYTLNHGYILQEEGMDEAAHRILEERTGLKEIYLDQFRAFGNTGRSSKPYLDQLVALNQEELADKHFDCQAFEWTTQRFISIGYYALVDTDKVVPQKNPIDVSIAWYPIKELPPLVLDQQEMVEKALETLRLHMDQKLVAFNLLPETFTMREVQELYEAVFDKPFARTNFQKKILDLEVLERLEKKFTGTVNKAPYLYRFRK